MGKTLSPYGCTFGAQGNLQPVPDRIATMVKMGIGNMRLFCNWDAIETKDPTTGEIKFDFAILDGVIRLANQAGIAVTYCLDSAPAWHQDNTLCSGKAFMIPEDAAIFLAMIAHRYTVGDPANPGGLFIVGVEGANEGFSDGAQHCQVGPYAANHMKVIYPAVKAVNPNLVVGSPAIIGLQLSYITDWMEAFYSNGGGDYSDYDHFHFYTQLSPIDTPEPGHASFALYYQAMAAVQEKYGYGKKPLRCTEIGYAVPGKSGSFTYQQQSDNYIAALDIARQSGGKLEMVELFTIGGSDGFSPVEHLGANEVEHELVAAHASYVKQYPTWDTQGTGGNNVTEVADFLNESQFIGGRSAYECVAYCCSLCKFAGKPGTGPTGSVLASSNLAQYWYGRETGSNLSSNTSGMSVAQEEDTLSGMGLAYHPLPITGDNAHDINYVKAWLKLGFPVIICGHEDSFFDLDLGDKVPYSWTPTGNHALVASGIASDGNLLVRDTASIAPTGVRPGPRRYDAAKMVLVSGTAIAMPWLPVVPDTFDPTKGGTMVPNGWHDDGHTLIAPNSVPVVLGFRSYVLSHNWESDNYPLGPQYYTKLLEDSNPNLGDGDQILFRRTMLGYPHNPQGSATSLKDTVIEEFVGSELVTARTLASKYYAAIQTLTAQLTSAQQQIQQLQSQQQGNPQDHALLLQVKQLVASIS